MTPSVSAFPHPDYSLAQPSCAVCAAGRSEDLKSRNRKCSAARPSGGRSAIRLASTGFCVYVYESSLIQRLRQTRSEIPAPQPLQFFVRPHLSNLTIFHHKNDVCMADRAPGNCQRYLPSRGVGTHSLCATAMVVLVIAASSSAFCTTLSL